MVSLYIRFQAMMRKQHYRQCQNGTLKAIIATTWIEFNLPDTQVTELAIQARVKRMRRKENKKNCAVHTSTVIVTPEKPQRIKEMPDFIDPKLAAEHTFDMVVNRLQFLMNGTIILSKEKCFTFLPALTTAMGPEDQISLMRESYVNSWSTNMAGMNQKRSSTGWTTAINASSHCNSSMRPTLQSTRYHLG